MIVHRTKVASEAVTDTAPAVSEWQLVIEMSLNDALEEDEIEKQRTPPDPPSRALPTMPPSTLNNA